MYAAYDFRHGRRLSSQYHFLVGRKAKRSRTRVPYSSSTQPLQGVTSLVLVEIRESQMQWLQRAHGLCDLDKIHH